MSKMSKVANEVELVVRSDGTAELYVDGQAFPWDVLWDDLVIESNHTECPTVTITLLAERVVSRLEAAQPEGNHTPEGSAPWELGWRFTFNEVEPPKNVLRVRSVNDEGGYPVLGRVENGKWSWMSETGQLFTGEADTWGEWHVVFGDREFEVVSLEGTP